MTGDTWLTIAKLLQPLVSCAHPSRFIFVRAISLKIAVQTFRWSEFLGQPTTAKLDKVFTREVREAMARVNREAAQKYMESCSKNDWESISNDFSVKKFVSVNKALARLVLSSDFLWEDHKQAATRRNLLGYSALIGAAAAAAAAATSRAAAAETP